jgi:zinc-binding alcohol dehydrogenase family protein
MDMEMIEAQPEGGFKRVATPIPLLGEHDVLVQVKATGLNPIDGKQRTVIDKPKVLGFDAVGIVAQVGASVQAFQPRDRVFYSGDIARPGSLANYQLVREEIMALAPQNLTNVEAATIPLTFLTAYELLVDKFGLVAREGAATGQTLFIVNGAGAVGRVMTQLAKWMGMQVIVTASTVESQNMVRANGADYVVNHYEDYLQELKENGWTDIPYIALLHEPNRHFAKVAELIAPFGHIGMIVAPDGPVDIGLVKNKSVSLDWEFMFVKASNELLMETQGAALALAAELSGADIITPYVGDVFAVSDINSIEESFSYMDNSETYGKAVIRLVD